MNLSTDILTKGYINFPELITDPLLSQLQDDCDSMDIIKGQASDGVWYNKFHRPIDYSPDLDWTHGWTDMIEDDNRIVFTVKQKLAPIVNNILPFEWCWHCVDYRTVFPGCDFIQAHVDSPYQYKEWENNKSLIGLQIIVALDDMTAEKGATAIVPNSHQLEFSEEGIRKRRYNQFLKDNCIYFEGIAGSAIMYHPRMLHSSMPNNSTKKRRVLLINVVRQADVHLLYRERTGCL